MQQIFVKTKATIKSEKAHYKLAYQKLQELFHSKWHTSDDD